MVPGNEYISSCLKIKIKLIKDSFPSHVKISFQALKKKKTVEKTRNNLYLNPNRKQNAHNSSFPNADSIKGPSLCLASRDGF